ncbi:MAG: hypothetical protein HN350_20335 [Phycisphaerales bacterium]|jgi:hypothetical protein|nr:hypothetical protein [Phycisphaerales bacterium]
MSIEKNPIKVALVVFVCFLPLVLNGVLSADVGSKPRAALYGILYALFLPYCVIGVRLLAKKWRRVLRYVLLSLVVIMLVLLGGVYYGAVHADPPFDFTGVIGFTYTGPWLAYPTFAIMIIAPAFGWIGYFKKSHN